MIRRFPLGFGVVCCPADEAALGEVALGEASVRPLALPPELHSPALLCSVLVVLYAFGQEWRAGRGLLLWQPLPGVIPFTVLCYKAFLWCT